MVKSEPCENGMDNTRSFVPITNGTMISHYEIIEKIGAGGMGEVYLAEDTELNRKVALKFLPPHLCQDEDCRSRFKREAQATAKLNHPNIVTIYEVGDHNDRPYFAMEHIEGRVLREVIKNDELSILETVEIAIGICEGLDKAHQAGIIHRDIKPSNIVIDVDGSAKLLDFGLAAIQGSEKLTMPGSTLGTIGYMSPEQIEAKDIDQRSDLFSLGVVLYEMVVGRPPFKGNSEAAVSHALLNSDPEPLARFRANVSMELDRIIQKALRKDINSRYQSAVDLLADLKHHQSKSKISSRFSTELKMLVVLPFDNLGPPDEEYFADGVTEEITSRLAAVRKLGVISRTSAMKYKNERSSIKEIASDLGVDYVLEGTVRWNRKSSGDSRVRITPQLIRVSDDTHLWSERYDRVLDDIFDVQSEIAERVIEQLNIALLEPERRIVEAKPTSNLDAYQAYLRGLEYAGRPDYAEEDFRLAVQMFERAVELDGDFALAYADLSRVHSALYFHGYDRTEGRVLSAKKAIDRAHELQPALPDVHLALGYYHHWCHQDYEKALEEFAIAERDLPNDTRILAVVAAIIKRQGRIDETVDNYKKAFELSPRDASLAHEIGCAYMIMRKYREADNYYDRSISIAPDQTFVYICKAWNYWLHNGDIQGGRATLEAMPRRIDRELKRPAAILFELYRLELLSRNYEEALNVLDQAEVVFDEGQWYFTLKDLLAAHTYQLLDDENRSRELYESAIGLLRIELEKRPDDDRVYSSLGIAYAGLGQKGEAIASSQKAVEIIPVSKNAVIGPFRVEDQAFSYTLIGECDKALECIEYLLAIPSWFSIHLLQIDPKWDALRDHPHYRAILRKYGDDDGT
ncbi:MAG: protein kinase [candidate division Zixibacteria bacterium]